MAEPKAKRATYADVLAAPERQIAEIVGGELLLTPRPTYAHAAVTTSLVEELGPPFRRGRGGPGGWTILIEPELHLDDDVVVPDLASWRNERAPQVADVAFSTIAPDWLCEVLSPSTEKIDRAYKLPLYAAAGVGHAWVIHPRNRTLDVLRLHEGKWLTIATHLDNARVRAEPFDAIELDLSMLWAGIVLPPHRASEPVARYETPQ